MRYRAETKSLSILANSPGDATGATIGITGQVHRGRSPAVIRGHAPVGSIASRREQKPELPPPSLEKWSDTCLDYYPVLVFQIRNNAAAP